MRSPLRTEADAFRFLGVVIVGAALIVGASSLNTWLGVAVAALAVGAVSRWYWHQPSPGRPPPSLHPDEHSAHRILVIANETVGGRVLSEELIRRAAGRRTEILVVAPALNSPLRHWVSDEDAARTAAQERVDASVRRLTEAGLSVRGEIGDGHPLQAIEDALRTFGADEIVISTHPVGHSHWLEHRFVEQARERFACPITHVVVDLKADRGTPA